MKKIVENIYGKGLFVRKDIHGRDCNVGDIVRITKDQYEYQCRCDGGCNKCEETEGIINIKGYDIIGRIHLLKSQGIRIVYTNSYGSKSYLKAEMRKKVRYPGQTLQVREKQ